MEFLNDKNFAHPFIEDITRINYSNDMPIEHISDYGYSYIMLRYGKIKTYNYKNSQVKIPEVFIKGTGDFFKVQAFKESSWLSFELPNHVLYNVTQIPSTKNRNKLLDLSLFIEEKITSDLYKEMANEHDIKVLEEMFHQHLGHFYEEWNKELQSTPLVDFILTNKGLLTIQDLLDHGNLSERTAERLFHKEVGTTPYRFICLVRFNYIIREIEKNNDIVPIVDLIEQYNYYDQSHFEKDFKKFLGQSIKTYKNEYNPLLTNGLARKYTK